MRITAAALTAATLLATLTACGSSDDTAGSKAPSKPKPSPTSPAPSPTLAAPMTFGKTVEVRNDEEGTLATVTILGYEQGIKASTTADDEFGTNGYVWATLELKLCSTKGTSGATRYPWALAYTDGSRIEPSGVTYGDFPKPEYPYEAMVKEGDCIRGKTVFAVPGDERPDRVLYTTKLFDTPPEWHVPNA
ncbi:hypothetical protein [Streptomyces clavifer]|uniref:hypothetical protein n=1 Tax=Streptomyces clavifer TaxID=68188 RepID=UPI00308ADAB2|nr:hypothetical protein OG388_26725 [Streptomyces clavifer]